MCVTCTDTEAEPCDVHGHDVPHPDDVMFPADYVCTGCRIDGDEALADNEGREIAWMKLGFELDRS